MLFNNSIHRFRNYQKLSQNYVAKLKVPTTKAEILQVRTALESIDRNHQHFFVYALTEAKHRALIEEEYHISPFLERWSRRPPSFVAQIKARMGFGEFIHSLIP